MVEKLFVDGHGVELSDIREGALRNTRGIIGKEKGSVDLRAKTGGIIEKGEMREMAKERSQWATWWWYQIKGMFHFGFHFKS